MQTATGRSVGRSVGRLVVGLPVGRSAGRSVGLPVGLPACLLGAMLQCSKPGGWWLVAGGWWLVACVPLAQIEGGGRALAWTCRSRHPPRTIFFKKR